MQTVKLPQLAWYGPKELELTFPDSWDIKICNIAGHDRVALDADQIKQAVTDPISMAPLRELAKGKKDVVIIFDDLTRGTRTAKIIPFLLEELALAGIPDDHIRFMSALGAHAPLSRIDLAKKVGEDVIARYAVYNHNAFDNCVHVGTTSAGTDVRINGEVMACDLKIAIGSVAPHPFAVFSGGGKIILPGVASIDTIMANHIRPLTEEHRANYETNPRRKDIEEAASFVKLDMLLQSVVNSWGETVSLHAGAPQPVREAAVKEAKTHFLAPKCSDSDIVISNAYIKASESNVVLKNGFASVADSGGDMVMIANAPGGQVPHYLIGHWGKNNEGDSRHYKLKRPPMEIPAHINHLIRYSEYPDVVSMDFAAGSKKAVPASTWDDVLTLLKAGHPDGAKVAVYPNADVMYFSP
ncbi:MAG: DUF2088 domain-containing protein [Chloroflexi bacterium]|jgi:lactate racemase|nr:DUF2088 domain-containing protein [Chloroflexota bacterium]MBT7081451.1 DUF2088 domain-containing protein [Chloroflexota bacterium]MBT7290293.1 DUF2088 domain-containing protein [Chloroflexota bacterium]